MIKKLVLLPFLVVALLAPGCIILPPPPPADPPVTQPDAKWGQDHWDEPEVVIQ